MINFNAWYIAQSEPMQIAVIGAVVATWGTLTAAVVAVLVAWVQAKMARRAVEAQERSVFLSLIDRRARWFDEAMHLWSDWIAEQEQLIEAVIRNEEPQTRASMRKIAMSRREANWLFGTEVMDHLSAMEKSVSEYSQKRMRIRELGVMPAHERSQSDSQVRYAEYNASLIAMADQQSMLASIVSPYLNVADIKAPRPAEAGR